MNKPRIYLATRARLSTFLSITDRVVRHLPSPLSPISIIVAESRWRFRYHRSTTTKSTPASPRRHAAPSRPRHRQMPVFSRVKLAVLYSVVLNFGLHNEDPRELLIGLMHLASPLRNLLAAEMDSMALNFTPRRLITVTLSRSSHILRRLSVRQVSWRVEFTNLSLIIA